MTVGRKWNITVELQRCPSTAKDAHGFAHLENIYKYFPRLGYSDKIILKTLSKQ